MLGLQILPVLVEQLLRHFSEVHALLNVLAELLLIFDDLGQRIGREFRRHNKPPIQPDQLTFELPGGFMQLPK